MSELLSEIILNNVRRERKPLSKYACQSRKGIRKDENMVGIKSFKMANNSIPL